MKRKFLLLVMAPAAFLSQSAVAAPKEVVEALLNATIIDGNGSAPQPGMTIIIRGERIAEIYRTGSRRVPPGAVKFDLSGNYVLPGLIDSHYHLLLTRGKAEETARQKFAFLGGVTSVRDMAGDGAALAVLAKELRDPEIPAPRVFFSAVFAGPAWYSNDDRVSLMMHGLPAGQAPWARAIAADTNIKQAVTAAKATGATGVKIYADLNPAQVEAITSEAHRQGLRVWTHATISPSRPSEAVKAGVDSISHSVDLLFELTPPSATSDSLPKDFYKTINWKNFSATDPRFTALFDLMRQKGTMLDATVAHAHTRYTLRQLARPVAERTISDPQGLDDFTFAITRRANELGVAILAGTDFQESPSTQTYPNIHQELELLVTRSGLSPLQAIKAATFNGAVALGKEREIGRVAKGKFADLLILRADPSVDIRNTRAIRFVVKAGKFYRGTGSN